MTKKHLVIVGTLGAAVGVVVGASLAAQWLLRRTRFEQKREREVPASKTVMRVAITGGPCSGKSTSVEELKSALSKRGYKVFVVPEAATLLFHGGAVLDDPSIRRNLQEIILRTVIRLENTFVALANSCPGPSIVLCDRGVIDGSVYCTESEWNAILEATGYSNAELRDGRYDVVFHLVTAANGAEEAYNRSNNEARFEGISAAIEVDAVGEQKWRAHPQFFSIDNSTNFSRKVQRVLERILSLAPPLPEHHNDDAPCKLLIDFDVDYDLKNVTIVGSLPEKVVEVTEVAVYQLLTKPLFTQEKVIERRKGGESVFYYRAERAGNIVDYRINKAKFDELCATRLDKRKEPVQKTHNSFVYNGQPFIFTQYSSPAELQNKVLLSVPKGIELSKIPPSFHVIGCATTPPSPIK